MRESTPTTVFVVALAAVGLHGVFLAGVAVVALTYGLARRLGGTRRRRSSAPTRGCRE